MVYYCFLNDLDAHPHVWISYDVAKETSASLILDDTNNKNYPRTIRKVNSTRVFSSTEQGARQLWAQEKRKEIARLQREIDAIEASLKREQL